MDRELREWLALAPADVLCYVSYACLVGMIFVTRSAVDWWLAGLALGLALAACFVGMRHDDRVSEFTNVMKKISYPLNLLFVLVLVGVHEVFKDGGWQRLLDWVQT